MSRYRKKPVVIEAWRLEAAPRQPGCDPGKTVANWRELTGLLGDRVEPIGNGEDDILCLVISTLEGTMQAGPGDWIIRGVKGELYPCKNDIFEATYEPA